MRAILGISALLILNSAIFAQDEIRTVTVNGSGSASTAPDRATVQMSIIARNTSVAEAQEAAAEVTAKILAMTDRMGIDRDKIDTTGSSVQPEYRWNREREEQELRGYIAQRQMRIDVRDLDKLGALVEGAVEAGVNQVHPPQLDSSKRRDAYREALDAAAKDAQANARQLAESLGANLGNVLQISTVPRSAPPMPMMRGAMALEMEAGTAAPETYNAGDLNFDATVTAIFELTE
jgi:hypothetical protein